MTETICLFFGFIVGLFLGHPAKRLIDDAVHYMDERTKRQPVDFVRLRPNVNPYTGREEPRVFK